MHLADRLPRLERFKTNGDMHDLWLIIRLSRKCGDKCGGYISSGKDPALLVTLSECTLYCMLQMRNSQTLIILWLFH